MALFILIGGVILCVTIFFVYWGEKQNVLSHHRHALIVAVGLGLTWMLAPLAPLIVMSDDSTDIGFVIFWVSLSVIVSICVYFADRLYLKMRR